MGEAIPPPGDPSALRRAQWRGLLATSSCYLFYETGRQNFGWAIPGIREDLSLSNAQIGSITGTALAFWASPRPGPPPEAIHRDSVSRSSYPRRVSGAENSGDQRLTRYSGTMEQMRLGNGRLRLVSANLANSGAHPEAFAELVRALEPDVVAVQELAPEQAEALARVMPFGRLEPARDHTGMGIALRAPGTVRRVPLPYRPAYVAELRIGAGPDAAEAIEVVNVHMAAPHVPPVWRALGRRRGQLRGLEAYLDASPGRRRAVVGDLNATPLWPVYRRLAARLTDAAVEAARGNGGHVRATWGPWPGSPRLLRIDHVLVSGLAVHRLQVAPVRGSDHSAVVVDLLSSADR